MKKKGRTNYSPIRRMSQNLHDDFPPMELQNSDRLSRHTVYASELENVRAKTPEEVYICNCCCVSKELGPSIKLMSTFKSLFFLFNFLVFVLGLANLGMGLWLRIDPKVYEIHKYIETQNFTIAGWIMLFCGFIACLMALAGFVAATRQAAGALVFYFAVMIAITLAFVGTLVLLTVYGFGSNLQQFITKEIYQQITTRSMNSESDIVLGNAAQFLDFIQVKMRCCGANDFRDYAKLGMDVPTTCYTIEKNFVQAPGCGRAIRDLFDLRAGLATGFTSASIVVQLLTIILSALMFCAIYNWRANPRPMTPMTDLPRRGSPATQLYHQRPRSRTPIAV